MEVEIVKQNRKNARQLKNAYGQREFERDGAPKGI
jgi:hypothetical protein